MLEACRIKSNELAASVIYRLTDQGSCYDPILPMYPACYHRDKEEAEMRAAPEVTAPREEFICTPRGGFPLV